VRDRVVWAIALKNLPKGLTCRWVSEEKGICTATKNFAYISPICWEAPLGGICIKFCVTGPLADVINRAKFYLNRVRGFDSVGGSNFWHSHKKEKSPLTQGLNYCSACDFSHAFFPLLSVLGSISFKYLSKFVHNVKIRDVTGSYLLTAVLQAWNCRAVFQLIWDKPTLGLTLNGSHGCWTFLFGRWDRSTCCTLWLTVK